VKQRSIDIVIERLLIDEEFRREFLRDSHAALWELFEQPVADQVDTDLHKHTEVLTRS
jgi:hypothetical protein